MPMLSPAPRTVVCFEHQVLTRADFADGRDFDWLLEQSLQTFGLVRKNGAWQIKVGAYLGVIGLPSGAMLEILPKIARTSGANSLATAHQTRQWLANMLARVWDLPGKSLTTLATQQPLTPSTLPDRLDAWLLVWWCHVFTQLWQRYMPNQRYQAHADNANALQGKLLLREQLRHNAHQPTRFYQHIDQHSADTACNRLVKTAYQRLQGMTRGANQLPALPFAWRDLPMVRAIQYDALWQRAEQELAILPAAVAHANTRLLRFCYDVLSTPPTGASYGEAWQPTLLFNMNTAFERWVSRVLTAKVTANAVVDIQKSYDFVHDDQNTLSIRPDVVIRQGDVVRVLDIKWKVAQTLADIAAQDLYQILAYAETLTAQQAWLVYPTLDTQAVAKQITFNQARSLMLWRVPFCVLNENLAIPPNDALLCC